MGDAEATMVMLLQVCLLTGCIHIFVFYSLWWIGEVSLKVSGQHAGSCSASCINFGWDESQVKYFCRAWQQARAFNGFRHGRSSDPGGHQRSFGSCHRMLRSEAQYVKSTSSNVARSNQEASRIRLRLRTWYREDVMVTH